MERELPRSPRFPQGHWLCLIPLARSQVLLKQEKLLMAAGLVALLAAQLFQRLDHHGQAQVTGHDPSPSLPDPEVQVSFSGMSF